MVVDGELLFYHHNNTRVGRNPLLHVGGVEGFAPIWPASSILCINMLKIPRTARVATTDAILARH
jgi:hypothetical protein